ncbi:hypothetical protein D3C71_1947110 [compost metagenome]
MPATEQGAVPPECLIAEYKMELAVPAAPVVEPEADTALLYSLVDGMSAMLKIST